MHENIIDKSLYNKISKCMIAVSMKLREAVLE